METRAGAAPRSLPRKRDRRPERAELLVGVDGAKLDATVDALALSGVRLELVAVVFVVRGFFMAERAGGGGRGVYEREGDRGGVEQWDLDWDRDWVEGRCAEVGRALCAR